MVGVKIVTKAVKPTMTADKRLKRTESHLLTAQSVTKLARPMLHAFHAHLPTSNSMGLYSNIYSQKRFSNDRCDSTVSTLFSISRKNFEDAPKARRIVTPEIVSP